jgi:3-oxo-5-alpha-steroid 4-dehydrogenase 1
MSELHLYYTVLFSFLALGVVTFIVLLFISAPYGKHSRPGWGILIDNRIGWVMQEAPASLLMFVYFFAADRPASMTTVLFLVIWETHYFHRAFIYPFTLRGHNRIPLSTVLLAILFNVVNTYVQGRWLFTLSPETLYTVSWLSDPRFVTGVLVFYIGFIINKQSDYILSHLRKPGESGYVIPRGGLFTYVSSPNYLGEIITWAGWTIATWSLGGLFFLAWSIANLVPRARSHHAWYRATFLEYPAERKIIIPFIY